jgi:hypothetical protein
MSLLLLKITLAPLLIAFVTLVGRRWGPGIGGWLMGFPLTSGPVSILLYLEYGRNFAAHAAVGNLGGQASVCVFCLAYSLFSQWTGWPISAVGSVALFMVSVALWNSTALSIWPTAAVFLVIGLLVIALIPNRPALKASAASPGWDLPARMIAACVFTLLLTTFANLLGPQFSGLISPFPLFGVIITSFTHQQQGAAAASQVVRGVAWGSFAFNTFFLVVALLLPVWPAAWVYLAAAVAAVGVNSISLRVMRRIPLSIKKTAEIG